MVLPVEGLIVEQFIRTTQTVHQQRIFYLKIRESFRFVSYQHEKKILIAYPYSVPNNSCMRCSSKEIKRIDVSFSAAAVTAASASIRWSMRGCGARHATIANQLIVDRERVSCAVSSSEGNATFFSEFGFQWV